MQLIDCLVLDLKFYPGASSLRQALVVLKNKNNYKVMELNPNSMADAEWDEVLDNILRAQRSITL